MGLRCEAPLGGREGRLRFGSALGRVGFKGGSLIKTDAFLSAHPFGTVPAAFSPDGTTGIFESNSIMRAVARLGADRLQLYGRDAYEASRIDSFLDASLVFGRDSQPYLLALRGDDLSADLHARAAESFAVYPAGIDQALHPDRHYLVGDALSLADICFVAELCLFSNERPRATLRKRGLAPVLADGWREAYPRASAHFDRLSIIRPLRRMFVLICRSWRHLPHDQESRARRCPHRRGRPRYQFELCEAVREGGHACRRRRPTAGQAGPAGARESHGVRRYACDAADPAAIELLFENVVRDLGTPTLVVHNIDGRVPGIFRKGITDAEPGMAFDTLRNAAFSAFLVGQQAARLMRENEPNANGAKGTIIFTNASAALKGFPTSGAFAMACHAKAGLAQSMARELMPQGIHVANVPIDAAIGWTQEDGTRAHRLAGTSVDDNMADPDHIAETYLQLHRQHRSTWAFEVVLRPWVEKW